MAPAQPHTRSWLSISYNFVSCRTGLCVNLLTLCGSTPERMNTSPRNAMYGNQENDTPSCPNREKLQSQPEEDITSFGFPSSRPESTSSASPYHPANSSYRHSLAPPSQPDYSSARVPIEDKGKPCSNSTPSPPGLALLSIQLRLDESQDDNNHNIRHPPSVQRNNTPDYPDEIELVDFIPPPAGTCSTENLIPTPSSRQPGPASEGGRNLGSVAPPEQKSKAYNLQPPNYKPFPLRWPFHILLLILIAGVLAFFEYEMHHLPPMDFQLFQSQPASTDSERRIELSLDEVVTGVQARPGGSRTSVSHPTPFDLDDQALGIPAPKSTPNIRPPPSLYPGPVKTVSTRCGWGAPEWGMRLVPFRPGDTSSGPFYYWLNGSSFMYYQYRIPTFYTDDESWCPCMDSRIFSDGWGDVRIMLYVGTVPGATSHDPECNSVMNAVIFHNWVYQGPELDLSGSSGRDLYWEARTTTTNFVPLSPTPNKPSWMYPSTNTVGSVVLPLWRETFKSGIYLAPDFLRQHDFFGNPIVTHGSQYWVATTPARVYPDALSTPPPDLIWWTLPLSKPGSTTQITSSHSASENPNIQPSATSDISSPTMTSRILGTEATDARSKLSTPMSKIKEETTGKHPTRTGSFIATGSLEFVNTIVEITPLIKPAFGLLTSELLKEAHTKSSASMVKISGTTRENRNLDATEVDASFIPSQRPGGPSSAASIVQLSDSETRIVATPSMNTASKPQSTSTLKSAAPQPLRSLAGPSGTTPPGLAPSTTGRMDRTNAIPTPPPAPTPGGGPIPPGAEARLFNVHSSADFLMVSLIPVLTTTLLAMAIQVFVSSVNTMLPFRSLTATSSSNKSRKGKAVHLEARDSLLLPRGNPNSSSLLHGPGTSWRFLSHFRDPLPLLNFLLSVISMVLVPLSNEVIRLELTTQCDNMSSSLPQPSKPPKKEPFHRTCAFGLRRQDTTMRITEALLVLMAILVISTGYTLRRWKTGAQKNVWSVSAMAGLLSDSSAEFRQLMGYPPRASSTASTSTHARGGNGKWKLDIERNFNKAMAEKCEGLRFRLRHHGNHSVCGIDILHPTIEDDKTPIKATNRNPPQRRPIDRDKKKTWDCFQWVSSLKRIRMTPDTVRATMNTTALILTAGLLIVILYYENTEVMPSERTGFESFMSGQSLAVRVLFTALGTAIALFWDDYFSYISSTIIHGHLSKQQNRDFLLHTSPPAHIFDLTSIYRTMVKTRDWSSLSIALACFFAKFTPILLSNVPFRNTVTWDMHEVCTWMAVGVLSYMVIVLGAHCLVPSTDWLKRFLPLAGKKRKGQKEPGEDKPGIIASTGMDNIAGFMYYSKVYYKDLLEGTSTRTV